MKQLINAVFVVCIASFAKAGELHGSNSPPMGAPSSMIEQIALLANEALRDDLSFAKFFGALKIESTASLRCQSEYISVFGCNLDVKSNMPDGIESLRYVDYGRRPPNVKSTALAIFLDRAKCLRPGDVLSRIDQPDRHVVMIQWGDRHWMQSGPYPLPSFKAHGTGWLNLTILTLVRHEANATEPGQDRNSFSMSVTDNCITSIHL
jgi:hypothetical protein